jgi:NADH:ubiquinone oxidoreductase subunit 5 (subunit L)/multisubunit Na+/H+ antiporter MnhA subunit
MASRHDLAVRLGSHRADCPLLAHLSAQGARFVRFFVLLGLFATGTQLVAWPGAGAVLRRLGNHRISSAFFIGFFHERAEPVRSSIRAFATYRFSDAGLLIATVATLEFLGSARFSAFEKAGALEPFQATVLALLFLVSAMGKSAQLPFSGWLPRAMEGPTPSSALFYGAVSIHAGLFLLLRVWPVLEVSPAARAIGVVVGLATAVYAAAVVREHTDARAHWPTRRSRKWASSWPKSAWAGPRWP